MIKRNYEIWKDIIDVPGYQISNFGRVKSLKSGLFLKGSITEKGYNKVELSVNKKRVIKKIHLLVIENFGKPKPSPKHECNHKDGIKSNNWNTNLEWLTHAENIQHSYDIGLSRSKKGELNGMAKLSKKKVKLIRKLYKSNRYTQTEIALAFKVSISTINYIVNNVTWKEVTDV